MSLPRTARRLARSPGFLVLSAGTLAVGISATVAIFSFVDALLIRPLPYPDSDRLVVPMHDALSHGLVGLGQAEATYRLYRQHNRVFDDFAIYSESAKTLTGAGDPELLETFHATPSLFPVLGVSPALGRAFQEADGVAGAPPVAILSDALWRRRFGADPEVIGRSLVLHDVPTEVVGVLPPELAFPRPGLDAWLAMRVDLDGTELGIFGNVGLGRLAAGVSAADAEADLNRLIADAETYLPGVARAGRLAELGATVRAPRLRDVVVGELSSAFWILFGAMGFVLAVAGANVANLFLSRAAGRRQETAVRTALGASRGALFLGSLVESAAVALLAGLAGLAGAWGAVRLLVRFGPDDIPRLHEVSVDGRALALTAATALALTVIFGALPALASWRGALAPALAQGAGRRATAGRHRDLTRRLLVAGQVAVGLVLAVGAGLMARSFQKLVQVDPGFDPEGVMIARIGVTQSGYPDHLSAAAFFDRLVEKVGALPGVEAVGGVSALPIVGRPYQAGHAIGGVPVEEGDALPIFRRDILVPGYFEAVRIPLLEGRFLERADFEQRTSAVVVSESLARRHWGGASALGKRLAPGGRPDDDSGWHEVVGVVGDVRALSLTEAPPETVYYAMLGRKEHWWPGGTYLAIRMASGPPEAVLGPLRHEVRSLDPNLPLFEVRTLESVVRQARAPAAFTMALMFVAAAVALVLSAVGTFGTVSHLARQRTAEIGVRMALGARRHEVLVLVVRQGLALALAGSVAGLAGALVLTRWIESTLFGVRPLDPPTFVAAPLLLLAVALAASFLPAHRASRIDPVAALRHE